MPAPKRQAPIEVTLPAYGVYLLESHHAPSFRMGEQSHSFLELFFVHSGSGAFRIAGRDHPCQRNDVVVVPPRQSRIPIADNPAHPLTLYAVCVAGAVVRHEPAIFERLPVGRVRIGQALADETRATFRRLLYEQTQEQPFGPTLIVGLTLELLASLARATAVETAPARHPSDGPTAERRAAVERYVAGLAHRFFERTSLDDAAAELGMSRRRFTTLFPKSPAALGPTTWRSCGSNMPRRCSAIRRGASCRSPSSAATKSCRASTGPSKRRRAIRRATGGPPSGPDSLLTNPKCKRAIFGLRLPDLQIRIARPPRRLRGLELAYPDVVGLWTLGSFCLTREFSRAVTYKELVHDSLPSCGACAPALRWSSCWW